MPLPSVGFIVLMILAGIMDESTQEGKSWDYFSRDVIHTNKMSQWAREIYIYI